MSTFWAGVIALTVFLYVLLDGFDLGVGILFGATRDEATKRRMLAAISPVWDGNETWLVITGTVLFGAFPVVYASLLSAFYLPLIAMLGSLILRGVAFEYRHKAEKSRFFWDFAFFAGSLVASFVQGVTIGAVVEGIPMDGVHFAGGTFFWLTPFALLCGLALCLGYALLGACWLAGKDDGRLRETLYRYLPGLVAAVSVILAVIFVYSVMLHLRLLLRWLDRPYLFVFPAVGFVAAGTLVRGVVRKIDRHLFPMAALVFLTAFGTFAASFWPFMIPFAVTIDESAAPASSLSFMFWGAGVFVLPLTLVYTASVYRIFRGRTVSPEG
jgi:cytochrome d ubiquinol oxidase subunit II